MLCDNNNNISINNYKIIMKESVSIPYCNRAAVTDQNYGHEICCAMIM
jgi:hypothetical protein